MARRTKASSRPFFTAQQQSLMFWRQIGQVSEPILTAQEQSLMFCLQVAQMSDMLIVFRRGFLLGSCVVAGRFQREEAGF